MRRPHSRRLLALHEAAHACIDVARGFPVDFVTIEKCIVNGSEAEGYCLPRRCQHRRVEDAIDSTLAGYLAERRAVGPTPSADQDEMIFFWDEFRGTPDFALAMDLAARWPGITDEWGAYFYLLDRSLRVDYDLSEMWPAVEAVADKLLSRRRLRGADVEKIMGVRQ